MEEILASIRKIIADEPTAGHPASAPKPPYAAPAPGLEGVAAAAARSIEPKPALGPAAGRSAAPSHDDFSDLVEDGPAPLAETASEGPVPRPPWQMADADADFLTTGARSATADTAAATALPGGRAAPVGRGPTSSDVGLSDRIRGATVDPKSRAAKSVDLGSIVPSRLDALRSGNLPRPPVSPLQGASAAAKAREPGPPGEKSAVARPATAASHSASSAAAADAARPAGNAAQPVTPPAKPAAAGDELRQRHSSAASAALGELASGLAAVEAGDKADVERTPTSPAADKPGRAAAAEPGAVVRTLEDSVTDLLRPMLRQWLDSHMPRIVEKALRVELGEGIRPPVKKDPR